MRKWSSAGCDSDLLPLFIPGKSTDILQYFYNGKPSLTAERADLHLKTDIKVINSITNLWVHDPH
jgi:hypothetical protein